MQDRRWLVLFALPLLGLLLPACQGASAPGDASPPAAGPEPGYERLGLLLDPAPAVPNRTKLPSDLTPEYGIRVLEVETGSPADQAGIRKDDLILQYDGRYVRSLPMLIEIAIRSTTKAENEVKLLRGDAFQTATLKLQGFEPRSIHLPLLFSRQKNDFFKSVDILTFLYNLRMSREYRLIRFNIVYERKRFGNYGHHRFLYLFKFKTGTPSPTWL